MLIRGVTLTGTYVTDIPSVVTANLTVVLAGLTYSSGTTWADSSGNSNNYTLVNSPTFSGGVFTFNGTNQYVNSPDYNATYAMGTSKKRITPCVPTISFCSLSISRVLAVKYQSIFSGVQVV